MERKRALTLIEIIALFGGVCVLVALLFPFLVRARKNARRSSCQSNLKQIMLGTKQYCRDYDEKYPMAYANHDGVAGYNPFTDKGWAEVLQPYVKSTEIFQCPDEPNKINPKQLESDYWLSAPTLGVTEAKFADQRLTVMLGDGPQRPAAIVVTHGAIAYKGDAPSLKYNGDIWDKTGRTEGLGGQRHLEGLNFAFVDGHVKWMKPEKVTAAPISEGKPTFRLK